VAEIVVLGGAQELCRLKLGDGELTIGRLEDCDIVIDSPKASRKHARIVRSDDGWTLEDLTSANGCFVADERVRRHQFTDGSRVRIADHHLVFVSEDGAAAQEEVLPEPWMHEEEGSTEPERNWDLLQSVLVDPRAGQEGARRLQALFEISKTLEEAKDFNAVLIQIMDKAIAIMGAERGFLMLVDDHNHLQVHVARSSQGDITGLERESISHSLVRKVMSHRKPVLVLDAQSGELGTKSVVAHRIHSAICAPLMTRDVPTGVIYVDHRSRANAFTREDLAFFTTFALQAKSAIDSSKAYWELVDSLFRASDDFIVVCSGEGLVDQANRAAAVMLGLTPDELSGRKLEELVIDADRSTAERLTRDTLEDGVSGCELTLRGGDGNDIPMNVSSFALRDRIGNATGVCLIGRDLSELKGLIGKLEKANEFVRATFGRYLSDEIVESLLSSPDKLELGGEKRTVTILMSDLRGFTAVGERLPAEQVVRVINNFLGTMIDIIARHRGTIDEFIGDAILVIFGAPISRSDDAQRACACAVEMQRAMASVNERNHREGLPEVEMGIGLDTGDVVVGNIGSEKRSKYAVVGTHVNLTSRIESNTVGGQILISGDTASAAGGALRLGRTLRVSVKGMKEPLDVHELLGVGGDYDIDLPTETDDYLDLAPAVPMQFAEIEGKQVSDVFAAAELVQLGAKGAVIRSDQRVAKLANLKIVFDQDVAGASLDDLYAKVVGEPDERPGHLEIRFTSVPPDVRSFLDGLGARGARGAR